VNVAACTFGQTTILNPLLETQKIMWGQAYSGNVLSRMPAIYQSTIPSDVWEKTLYPAGMQIRFRTNAASFKVNYTSGSLYSYDYQSKVGSNGFDMYVRINDTFYFVYPNAHTIASGNSSFTYGQISPDDPNYAVNGYEYCLYLPEICQVSGLQFEINSGTFLEYIPVPQNVKPIVFYGTSIINGQNVSRPGNNITNIISRSLYDIPVVNMGFRSVARMESEVIAALNAIDAQVYFLDCLPNMNSISLTTQIVSRFVDGVDSLKKYHPNAAIVLVEHPGYSYQESYAPRKTQTENTNAALSNAYNILVEERGYKHIYYIKQQDLGLNVYTDFSDHIHPSDKGAYLYADAFVNMLGIIAADTGGDISITSSLVKHSEFKIYPNPATDKLNVEYAGNTDKMYVEINDSLGKRVYKKMFSKSFIDISALSAGIYVVRIYSDKNVIHSQKIIKK
jgi:hypothetical protein